MGRTPSPVHGNMPESENRSRIPDNAHHDPGVLTRVTAPFGGPRTHKSNQTDSNRKPPRKLLFFNPFGCTYKLRIRTCICRQDRPERMEFAGQSPADPPSGAVFTAGEHHETPTGKFDLSRPPHRRSRTGRHSRSPIRLLGHGRLRDGRRLDLQTEERRRQTRLRRHVDRPLDPLQRMGRAQRPVDRHAQRGCHTGDPFLLLGRRHLPGLRRKRLLVQPAQHLEGPGRLGQAREATQGQPPQIHGRGRCHHHHGDRVQQGRDEHPQALRLPTP